MPSRRMPMGRSLLCKNKSWLVWQRKRWVQRGRQRLKEIGFVSQGKEYRGYSEHKEKPDEDSDPPKMGCVLHVEPMLCLKSWWEESQRWVWVGLSNWMKSRGSGAHPSSFLPNWASPRQYIPLHPSCKPTALPSPHFKRGGREREEERERRRKEQGGAPFRESPTLCLTPGFSEENLFPDYHIYWVSAKHLFV